MSSIMRRAVIAFSVRNRRRKAAAIAAFMGRNGVRNVVFVGCSLGHNPNALIVETAVAERATVLAACDILDCPDVPWPFVKADGRDLPFPDGCTDMVLANAVIEHVGQLADQVRFVKEQTRVGRTWVITTPNRWFPIESHTSAVGRHWSRRWRASRDEFTRLMSLREFRDLLPDGAVVTGHPWSATFTGFYVSPGTAGHDVAGSAKVSEPDADSLAATPGRRSRLACLGQVSPWSAIDRQRYSFRPDSA